MTKRIYKYGTGDAIPKGAVYCSTVVEEIRTQRDSDGRYINRYVWHYFLVDTNS